MWNFLAVRILRYRIYLLALLAIVTAFMGWEASKVKLSYEFTGAIPTDNPKYLAYQNFRHKFGDDGNLLVVGIQTRDLFQQGLFNDYSTLGQQLKKVQGVTSILSVTSAVVITKSDTAEKLQAKNIFPTGPLSQEAIDSGRKTLSGLPFYKGLLYNPDTGAWLMGVSINPTLLNSPARTAIVNNITALAEGFGKRHHLEVHLSGLPLIRTVMANRIQKEMKFFLIGSVLLSALILLLFFRSFSATLLSLGVVIIGVVWSIGTLQLLGYKITILTALVPPLVVVIGVPNCIYFLNKFHTVYRTIPDKRQAIIQMITKMGIVTLFCNIAAAIGFAVFALTKSAILKEFGAVAGINIMLLFIISLILIPAAVSLLPPPNARHMKYLDNQWLQAWLDRLERWALHHRKLIFTVTALIVALSITGIVQLKNVGYIVDDIPKTDKIYTDLKFFEDQFKGVMPLEIVIDTRKKYGVTRNLSTLLKIDSLVQYLGAKPYIGKPLALTEGLKFAKQAFFEGDSTYYTMPDENDLLALRSYLSTKTDSPSGQTTMSRLVTSFIDSNKQETRISVNMKDVGSARLPYILDTIHQRTASLFDSTKYNVELTGTSITFLEGTRFIINGLKESIFWAFLLIALCMLYLFRSIRILLCSLLPNIIPLVITAGVMGWAGIALKPSTVLVFSVALGIAIDVTIRFLVNYKQQLAEKPDVATTVVQTIHSTGLSILYTSFVLIAGFVIFCFSGFGGTKALGWLTSLTLVTATIANLVLLPALLLTFHRIRNKNPL